MFINDNDVGTDCEGSGVLGEQADVQGCQRAGQRLYLFWGRKRERRGRRGAAGSERGHVRDRRYDVHERGRQ